MKNVRLLKFLLSLLVIALIVFVVAETRNVLAQRDYIGKAVRDRDTIAFSGTGKVTAVPDLAKVDLGVYSDGKAVKDVQLDNTTKMNAITAALTGMGVDAKDIQTSAYNLQPKIDWSQGKQNVIGYTLTQNVTVKVRDLSKVGDVIQKATDLGANQVNSMQFTVDDPSSLQEQARLKAIQDAQAKADKLSQELGLHIVKVVTFEESNPSTSYPMPMAALGIGGGSDKAVAPSIEAGSLDVTSNVTVTFEVR